MQTTFLIEPSLRDSARDKSSDTGISVNKFTTMWLRQWVEGGWEFDGESSDGERKTELFFIDMPDDLWNAVMRKRLEDGVGSSAIIREGLRKWVAGEYEVELVCTLTA